MEHSDQELLSLPEEIEVRKPRDHSVAWLIVFTSAALTLASATGRQKASSPLPLPASSGTVQQPAGPKCGPSCPKERTPAASDRRRPSFLAAAADPSSGLRRG